MCGIKECGDFHSFATGKTDEAFLDPDVQQTPRGGCIGFDVCGIKECKSDKRKPPQVGTYGGQPYTCQLFLNY